MLVPRYAYIIFTLFLSLIAARPALAVDKRKPRLTPAEKFLRQAPVKFHNQTFGKNDRKECESFLKKAKKDKRLPFLLVLARNYRIMEKKPIKGMELIGHLIVDKVRIKEWKAAQAVAKKEALSRWKEESRQAKQDKHDIPEKPDGLFTPFPKPADWVVDYTNSDAAIEIARCHIDVNRPSDALAIIDSLGKKFSDEMRALSAECAGDLMVQMQRIAKAIEMYEFGLRVLASLKSVDYTPEQKLLIAGIRRKLSHAQRLQRMNTYGKGWVLYCEAEAMRRDRHKFLEAYLAYASLSAEFPGTVYGEAGRCYSIICLLKLAEKKYAREAQKEIAISRKNVVARRRAFARLNLKDLPRITRQDKQKSIESSERRLERMKEVSLGSEAITRVRREIRSFRKDNPFGLYRGTVTLELAFYYMKVEFDPDEALKALEITEQWFNKVESIDHDLKAFSVPAKATGVSASPGSSFKPDRYNNLSRSAIKTGMIFNRLSCDWFLPEKKRLLYQALGFIAFFNKESQKATQYFKKMAELDELGKAYRTRGDWSDAKRLLWGVEHGFLYARPKELKKFSRKRRFGLLLGDYFYVTMQFSKALTVYQKLSSGVAGKPGAPEQAYLSYACGAVSHQLQRYAEAAKYFQAAGKLGKGITHDRALFAYSKLVGNSANQKLFGKEKCNAARLMLEKLKINACKEEFRCKAIMLTAKWKFEAGNREEALALLLEVPSKSRYSKLAMAYRQIFEEKWK